MHFASDGDSIATAILGALSDEDRDARSHAIEEAARTVDPDELIDAVADHADARRRNAALDALALGAVRSVPSLIRALGHEDSEVVMFAATALGKTRDKSAIPHLVKLLEQDDVNVAQAALDSLSLLRASAAVDTIIEILDRDPWVRLAAVHALGDIGDPRAVPALIPLLGDEEIRDLAVAALGKIRSPEALPHLAEVLCDAEEMDTFLTCLRAVGAVLERCADSSRLRAGGAGDQLASPDAASVHLRLLAVLSGEQDGGLVGTDVRETKIAAATLIRALHIRSLYTPMVLAGRDPRLLESLEFCAVALGEEIAESLRVAIAYEDKHVRVLACKCAADLRLTNLAARIGELLGDDEPEVREAAASALAYMGSHESARTLVSHLLDASPAVRKAVHEALCKLDERAVTTALLEREEREPAYCAAALEVMVASPHEDQLGFILDCAKATSAGTRRRAISALAVQPGYDILDTIERFLDDTDPSVREAALQVLGRRPSARARELLLAHMARDRDTRAAAVRAAAHLGDPSVGQQLIELFRRETEETRMAIVDALADLREPAAEPLIVGLLSHAEDEVRMRAAKALGAFEGEMSLRHLLAAARDPSPRVRTAVAEALCARPFEAVRDELERLALDEEPFIATMARHRLEVES
jgi:HEAT repeat protein